MASINQDQLGSMPIPLMSFQEQTLIAEGIEKRFSIISKVMKEIEESLQGLFFASQIQVMPYFLACS